VNGSNGMSRPPFKSSFERGVVHLDRQNASVPDGQDMPISASHLASQLEELLPNRRATLRLARRQIPGAVALHLAGGPGMPQTDEEAVERVDRLWAKLRRLIDTELEAEIATDEIVGGETTAKGCVEAARLIFRFDKRRDGWSCPKSVDADGIPKLRGLADKEVRPDARRPNRRSFEEDYEPAILLALARLLLRSEEKHRGVTWTNGGGSAPPKRKRVLPVVIAAAATVVAATAVVIAVVAQPGEQGFARNPAGEVGRTAGLQGAIDDLSTADGFAWIASSKDQSALRVDDAREIWEKFDIGLRSPTVKFPRGISAGSGWGGYQIAGGEFRAWIVTTAGTVAVLRPSFLGKGTRVAPIAKLDANSGPVEYALGYLWIGGLTGELVALDAFTGKVAKRYSLPGSLGTVEVAIGLGSAWALDFSGEKVVLLAFPWVEKRLI
jgi:hypothetical protein